MGYRYLLNEFISISSREHLSLNEIARKMKMTPSGMKNFLEMMERNGDLKSCSLGETGEKTEASPLHCMGCSACCCQKAASCSLKGKTYHITEKARKACL
ncbi:MAG: hypothetical protein PHW56_00420 [Methanosarcinaceae archaeon]|nr:hypothetical protein [Methanosarcinaceae archaeon]